MWQNFVVKYFIQFCNEKNNCIWEITTQIGNSIVLDFLRFQWNFVVILFYAYGSHFCVFGSNLSLDNDIWEMRKRFNIVVFRNLNIAVSRSRCLVSKSGKNKFDNNFFFIFLFKNQIWRWACGFFFRSNLMWKKP